MKRTSAELKCIAREALRGHYGVPIGAMVVSGLIISALNFPFTFSFRLNPYSSTVDYVLYGIVTFLINMLGTVLSSGLIRIHLRLGRGEAPQFSELFYGFTARPDRFLLGYLILAVVSILCLTPGTICLILYLFSDSILLLVFGIALCLIGLAAAIYLELTFALLFPLLIDRPSLRIWDAFGESARLMKGNKGRLFYIQLSFLGWLVLSVLSCYIGLLWLEPYIQQTAVSFYLDLTQGQKDNRQMMAPSR